MVTRLVFGIIGLISFSALADVPKEYVLFQLQNPHLSIPTRNGTKNPPNQGFSGSLGSVEASQMNVRWQASGVEVTGSQLRLGNVLGRLQVGHLTGKAYYQTPEVYWHWGPRVRWHQKEKQLFDFTTLGVGLITRHSLAVPLPNRFHLKMKYEQGKISRELVNRDEVNAFLATQVARLFDGAVFQRDFNTYTIGVNAYLDGLAQEALTKLSATVASTVRDGVMEEIGSPSFVDSMLDEVFKQLPPLRFTEGATADLEWTRGFNGTEPVWTLAYSKAGTAPSKGLVESWAATGDRKDFNRLRVAVAPDALQHMVEDTLRNFENLETPPGWPSSLIVNTVLREMVYRPQTAAEIRNMQIPFLFLFPRHTIRGNPDLVLSIDWTKHDNVKFRQDGNLLVIEAKMQAALASQINSDRTPWLPIQIRAWADAKGKLDRYEVKPLSVMGTTTIELYDLGPAMGLVLQQALGITPQAASSELERFIRAGFLGADKEALTLDFLQPLPLAP